MTLAELERMLESKSRVEKARAQERAINDYRLADLIGRSISRIYSSSAKLPELHEVYPTLFDSTEIEEQKQEKNTELSVLRFKQFAKSYNKKFEEVANDKCLKN